MPELSNLEKNILKAKGLTEEHIAKMQEAGIGSRADLGIVGDAETLCQLMPGLDPALAEAVMSWATGRAAVAATAPVTTAAPTPMLIDGADVVYCVHCKAKQPKDYKSGDLCISCGKQAEPVRSCFWCGSSGPGAFCRECGAEMVAPAELDLAVLLRHEGLAKDEVPKRLRSMGADEKDMLWSRVRKFRQ
jgi:hypothetical protein